MRTDAIDRTVPTKLVALLAATLLALGLVAASAGRADASAATRNAVVNFAYRHLGTDYELGFGAASCPTVYQRPGARPIDCECLNRLAIYGGTENATGRGLQLTYTLWGQIDQGRIVSNPRRGDLVFFDLNGDGRYGGDYDHTGLYVGGGRFVNANPVYGTVEQSVAAYNDDVGYGRPLYVDVLTPNGY